MRSSLERSSAVSNQSLTCASRIKEQTKDLYKRRQSFIILLWEKRTKGKEKNEESSESGEGIGAPGPAGRLKDVVKIVFSHDHFVSRSDGRHCATAGIPDRSSHLTHSDSSRRPCCLEHGQTDRACLCTCSGCLCWRDYS